MTLFQAAMDTVTGKGSDYWESRPGAPPSTPAEELGLDENQRAGLDYARRMLDREAGQ